MVSVTLARQAFRVLLLGGTGEAAAIAARLSGRPDLTIISSLAGRVIQPTLPVGEVRIGGFGGVDGLLEFLSIQRIDAIIDATHPYAARMSRHAQIACERAGLPLIAFVRPEWTPQAGERWLAVPDFAAAALLVDLEQNRILLAIGRQELAAFSACSHAFFLVRSIERPDVPLPPRSELLLSRGPFLLEQERALLRDHAITHVVSKNSGGLATYAKIEAARSLGVSIVIIERPAHEPANAFSTLDYVYQRIEELLSSRSTPPSGEEALQTL